MASLPQIAPSWLTPSGELNTDALLRAFLAFWGQYGEPLLGSTAYHEIALSLDFQDSGNLPSLTSIPYSSTALVIVCRRFV